MTGLRFALLAAAASFLIGATPAFAISGADALKQLNEDSDQTIELPEVLDASSKLFTALNKDNDLTLERAELGGLVTEAEWKKYNRDHDGSLELDEWLNIVRGRFQAADVKKTGKLSVEELDSPAGQNLLKLVVKE